MADMISITDAARKLGYSRPRLSALIDEHGIKKTKSGKQMLVDLSEVQTMLQTLAATQGKLRTPKPTRKPDAENELVTHLKEEVRRLTTERNEIQDRWRASVSAETELKLLKAAKDETDKRVEDLLDRLETLEAEAAEAKRLRLEIEDLKKRQDAGLMGKAAKIYDVLRGK